MGQRRQQKRLMAERKAAAQQAWIEKQKLIHEHYQQQCDPMKTAILDRCQEQEAFKAARPSQPQREQGSDQLRQHEHKQQQRSHLEPEQLASEQKPMQPQSQPQVASGDPAMLQPAKTVVDGVLIESFFEPPELPPNRRL